MIITIIGIMVFVLVHIIMNKDKGRNEEESDENPLRKIHEMSEIRKSGDSWNNFIDSED